MLTRRQTIKQQAWADIRPQAQDLYRARLQELLAEADLPPARNGRPPIGDRAMTNSERQRRWRHRRVSAQRADDFRGYIAALWSSGELDTADNDTDDLIREFLTKPSAGNRLRLLAHLKARPWLLGDDDLDRFE